MINPEYKSNPEWTQQVAFAYSFTYIYVTIIKKKRISTWGGVGGPGGRVRGRYWREDRKGGK